jgi:thiosulfate reductase cytochrome b subunit
MKSHRNETLEIRDRHPLAIRWFHWINFPLLFLMIWSGLMILWANNAFTIAGRPVISQDSLDFPLALYDRLVRHDPNATDHYTFGFRLAEGMSWHFLVMWLFAINGALYVLYLAFSGAWRFLLPKRGSFRHAWLTVLHDLHLRKEPPPPDGYNGAQRFAYTGVVVMGLGSLITGLAIYKPMQLSGLAGLLGGYTAARFEHFWLMIGFLAFFAVHVAQVIRAGWNNFRSMITGRELVRIEEAP